MRRTTVVRLVLTHAAGVVIVAGIVLGLVVGGRSFDVAGPTTILLVATLATGWLLAAKVPRNPIGWVLMWIAACFDLTVPLQLLGEALRPAAPGAAAWVYWVLGSDADAWAWVPPVWALLIWIPLHFPNGSLPSPRWRWVSGGTIALLVYASAVFGMSIGAVQGLPNPVGVPALQHDNGPFLLVFAVVGFCCFGATVASLVARYRYGGTLVRSQLRWMVWAVALTVLVFAVSAVLPAGPVSDLVDDWIFVAYSLIPVAVAIAVLKYRLYEIDRIISRTASYAIVTVVVIGTYALVVLLASLLLPQGQGDRPTQTPPVVIALATLAAAAVFLPVLRLMRRTIDRVFDRSRYDAERIVDDYGERIRNGADPHTAGTDLIGAIEHTLQPNALGLWVAGSTR